MRPAPILLILLLGVFGGCSSFDLATSPDGDAFPPDAGAVSDAAGDVFAPGDQLPPPLFVAGGPDDGGARSEVPLDPSEYDPSSCFDGTDNNASNGIDCDDPACAGLHACTIGNGERCEVGPQLAWDFESCSTPVAMCLAGTVTPFGNGSWLVGGMLHPGGDLNRDGGLVLGDAIDLTTTRLRIATSLASSDCDNCIESAGIALTSQTDLSGQSEVRPLAGLLLSGSRSTVSLVVGDTIVDSWDVPRDTAIDWELELRPTGELIVTRNAMEITRAQFSPSPDTRLVAYGRNHNRPAGMPNGARMGSVTASTFYCDMPTAWSTSTPVVILDSVLRNPVDQTGFRNPSFVDGATNANLAFETPDGIMLAGRPQPTEPAEFILRHPIVTPALTPSDQTYYEGSVRDPELFVIGDELRMFFTGRDGAGRAVIGSAVHVVDNATLVSSFTPSANPVLEGGIPGLTEDFTHLEMPSFALVNDSIWVLLVRATRTTGETELIPFVSRDAGLEWDAYEHTALVLSSRDGSRNDLAFDAQETSDPALIIHGSSYQLYYAGRRAARWGIGLYASEELVYWRKVSTDPLLSGRTSSEDALGVRAIDVISRGELLEAVIESAPGGAQTFHYTMRRGRGAVP